MRLAVSGSAGTGKSALCQALAKRLGLPYIAEGMRRRIESGLDLHGVDHTAFKALQWELMEELAGDIAQAEGGFVSDRSPLDSQAFWLYYGFAFEEEETARYLAACETHLAQVEANVILPWGVLPLEEDGVRSTNPHVQRHFQALLEGLALRRKQDRPRLLWLPEEITGLEARVDWVLKALARQK